VVSCTTPATHTLHRLLTMAQNQDTVQLHLLASPSNVKDTSGESLSQTDQLGHQNSRSHLQIFRRYRDVVTDPNGLNSNVQEVYSKPLRVLPSPPAMAHRGQPQPTSAPTQQSNHGCCHVDALRSQQSRGRVQPTTTTAILLTSTDAMGRASTYTYDSSVDKISLQRHQIRQRWVPQPSPMTNTHDTAGNPLLTTTRPLYTPAPGN